MDAEVVELKLNAEVSLWEMEREKERVGVDYFKDFLPWNKFKGSQLPKMKKYILYMPPL